MAVEKEPFVASGERPDVGLKPDTPISELRVRDLQALLQGGGQFKKLEGAFEKFWKLEKFEKFEKFEKYEKFEWDKWWDKLIHEFIPPVPGGGGDPAAIDRLVRTISGLSEQVTQLTRDVEQLKQRSGGG